MALAPATASTVSVQQVLELLDGDFSDLARGVAQGEYALWLGSGISRDRVDDLARVVLRVLEYLRIRVDQTDDNCKFRGALDEAIALARLSDDQRAEIDYADNVEDWSMRDELVGRLVGGYSRLLDIRIEGEADDYLLWEAVDVAATFSAAAADPDCEHLCLALLAIEGVLPDIAAPNWDGLIEAAVQELAGDIRRTLQVCVRAEDLRGAPLPTRLLKLHGCAVLAGRNPAVYRPMLIARQSQITRWPYNPAYRVMRQRLVDLAVTKPTLMIGLSAQDSNIQAVFAEAESQMEWPWPGNPLAHVFAEDSLGQDHKNVLRFVYRDAYTDSGAEIERRCLLRAYAKPLLVGFVLHVLSTKLQVLARQSNAPNLSATDYEVLDHGIVRLRELVAAIADTDRAAFIRDLVRVVTEAMTLFQEGAIPAPGPNPYRPIGTLPAHRIPTDASLPTSGMREMAAALGIIGSGETNGKWNLELGGGGIPADGPIRVQKPGSSTRVYFVANGDAEIELENQGVVSPSSADAVLVHSTAPVQRMARSPSAAPGRTGHPQLRHVPMAELLREAGDITELTTRFCEEASL